MNCSVYFLVIFLIFLNACNPNTSETTIYTSDFEEVKNELIKINYKGWIVVEQDIIHGMGDPKKYAIKNRKYLKSINL